MERRQYGHQSGYMGTRIVGAVTAIRHLVFVFGHSDRNTDRRTAWIVCNNGNCDHDAGYV